MLETLELIQLLVAQATIWWDARAIMAATKNQSASIHVPVMYVITIQNMSFK